MSVLRPFFKNLFDGLASSTLASWPMTRIVRRAPAALRSRVYHRLSQRPLARSTTTARCLGLRMRLDLNDDVQRAIYFGMFEREELEVLRGCISEGDVCIDAGANVGFYTCHLARWVGKSGHIHAFEPEPRNVESLAANVQLNGLSSQVTIHPIALSFEKGRALFHRAACDHSGWGSFHHYEGHVGNMEVETETVDGFLEGQGLEEIALLKVDVEGADFDVYRGAGKTLSKRAVRFIMAEWNGIWFPRQNRSFRDFTNYFAQFGYRPLESQHAMIHRYESNEAEALGQIVNVVFHRS